MNSNQRSIPSIANDPVGDIPPEEPCDRVRWLHNSLVQLPLP